MKLTAVVVKEFQSIRDSGEFKVGDITCLVGKNEAGKTALLQALYRLNPINPGDREYDVTDDYPRWDVADYRDAVAGRGQEPATVVRADFALDASDIAAVIEAFGPKALPGDSLTLSAGYDMKTPFGVGLVVDQGAAFRHAIARFQLPPDLRTALEGCADAPAVAQRLAEAEQTDAVQVLAALFGAIVAKGGLSPYVFETFLQQRVPKFLYFDEYYQLTGHASIQALKDRRGKKSLLRSDYPLLGLISAARLELEDLLNPTRTRELKNQLEGAGNHLTKRIIQYWSQNKHLQLRFDVREARPEDPEPEMRKGTNIWGEVYDTRRMVTTEIGSRSKGFVWFFSFLAWYHDVKAKGEHVILLLDEPGLTLHGRAQADFLRYLEEEVKGIHQVIYTTHSPFMVDPQHFDRVRIVQDLTIDSDEDLPLDRQGTKVTTDVLEATGDSLFPLQGALGYDLYQTLFVGPNSLVVEGVSDLLYLQTLSGVLQRLGRTGLNGGWTITPVGGADKVPTFVALIGAKPNLNVAVLIDFQKQHQQAIDNLWKKKLLDKKKVVTFADFVEGREADIEDLFDVDFYLELINGEYRPAKALTLHELPQGSPRVVQRVEAYAAGAPLAQPFSHYRPARFLAENIASLEARIRAATLDRFEEVFRRVNALL